MKEVGSSSQHHGCIKSTRGPWRVRRRGRGGAITTSLRRPSDRERNNNRLREQRRRAVASKIFSYLKIHGGFTLPKHADQNDILIALCRSVGYIVEDDGTIKGKLDIGDHGTIDEIDLSLTLGIPGSS